LSKTRYLYFGFQSHNWCDQSIKGTITVIVKADPCQGEPFPAWTDSPTATYTFTADATGCAKLAFDRPRASGAMVTQESGPEPGSCQKPGTYTLVFKATNWCDQSIKGTITVIVKAEPCFNDKLAPSIQCPKDIVTYADCGAACAKVIFDLPTATDNCDPSPKIRVENASGSCFEGGTKEVWCWATDKSGNESICSFKVTVLARPDKTPPTIQCPKDITISVGCLETCGKATFDLPSATDNCDANPKVTSNKQSGDCFPIGTTEVTCTAVDKSGNQSSCSFKVIVKTNDVTPPVISNCPKDIDLYVDCGLPCTSLMARMTPDAKDDCDPNPKVWCEVDGKPADMRTCFPLGKTTVTCYAQDAAGNKSSCSYSVNTKVKDDYIAPTITCPANMMVSLSSADTKLNKMCRTVDFTVTASDNCGPNPAVTCSVFNGTSETNVSATYCYPMGKTRVRCTATDKAGNTASCIFFLTVMNAGDLVKSTDQASTSIANKGKIGTEKTSSELETEVKTTISANKILARKELSIYPNPTNSSINLELQQYEGKNVAVQILNSFGREVFNTTYKEVSTQTYKIDMQTYPTGMYFIKATAEGVESVVKKVMKQ
jgi:HYR domain/Secretion system C-terminal sorting domain